MKILIIISLLIIVIFFILACSTFTNLQSNTYTLNTPGFGEETYTLPDLGSEGVKLNAEQYAVFVKYMNVPKIATFMSDNSQVEVANLDKVNLPTRKTISYNEAVGINSGTPSGKGRSNPPTVFQIDRTLLIIDVMNSLSKLYCSDNNANSSEKYLTNCVKGDILPELEIYFYLKPGDKLSLDPLVLDYPVYIMIWNILKNRHSVFVNRIAEGTYDTL
jgi:hypothetical protein